MLCRQSVLGVLSLGVVAVASIAAAQGVPLGRSDPQYEMHRHLSGFCFDQCWNLFDKPNRSEAETEDMVLLAHASLWHWKQRYDCEPLNLSIGYWQISRVHSLVGDGALALRFGQKCIRISEEKNLSAYYIGCAYEAAARAAAVGKDYGQATEYLVAAQKHLDEVTDKDLARYLRIELDAVQIMVDKGDAPETR